MVPENIVGFPEAVVGGTEGRPGPTGVPTTTAAAVWAGARAPTRSGGAGEGIATAFRGRIQGEDPP